ncbi:cytochrome b561 [Devosia crocina]|uniref:Cytochrome b561 n=1 Tax=Devosia crocina TaxID=429728 RepID=A0A1I7N114_9HYPH|nr:cytochrome b [Devosia crocina]SFV28362.1 cytochrome b561 [Devosia crocina]
MTSIAHYKPLAKAFHWLTALLVLLTIPAALIMLRPGIERSLQDPLFTFHKNIGVVIFVLVAVRLAYRLVNPPPPLPDSVPTWQRHVASLTHWLLYGLLLAMAISGYIRVTAGGFPLEVFDPLGLPRPVPRSEALAETAKSIHAALRYPLIGLIALHIGAALHHALIKRDGVFQRMLFNR